MLNKFILQRSYVLLVFLLACQNYNLYDRLTCPGCSGQTGGNAVTTPCVNCRIFVSQTTKGDMSGNGSCGGAGGGTASCGIGANGVQKADYVCQNDPGRPDTAKIWKALVVDGTNRVACTNTNCTGGTAGRVDLDSETEHSLFPAGYCNTHHEYGCECRLCFQYTLVAHQRHQRHGCL